VLAGMFAYLLWEPLSAKLKISISGENAVPVTLAQGHSLIDNIYTQMLHTGPLITIFALALYILIMSLQIKR
jgi:hypothetical protein